MKLETTNRTTSDGLLLYKILEAFPWGSLVVPAGFHTDLASCPRKLQWLLQERSVKSKAAAGHDKAYFDGMPKRIADAYFYNEMVKEGVRPFDREVMFWAVALFGRKAYERHRRLGHPEKHTNRF